MESTPLQDRVVAITGAAGRLGQRMTEAFAAQNAKVAAIDRASAAPRLPEESRGAVFHIDLADEEQVREGFAAIKEQLGAIEILVHTVGMWQGKPFLDTSLADWQRVLDVNLTTTFLCFREAARQMQETGGQLIAFASGQGLEGGVKEQAAYSASKAGVVRLVEALCDEYQDRGITTHAIAPSMILFDQSDRKGVPADELVRLVLYLTTDGAGSTLNGAVIRAFGTLL